MPSSLRRNPLPSLSNRETVPVSLSCKPRRMRCQPVTTSARADNAFRESPEAKHQRLEQAIARNTDNWTKPLIVATYPAGEVGLAAYRDEAPILAEHDYFPVGQISEGGHLHAGRLIANRRAERLGRTGRHP